MSDLNARAEGGPRQPGFEPGAIDHSANRPGTACALASALEEALADKQRCRNCVCAAWLQAALGWAVGFEPTTTGITTRGSTAELYPHHRGLLSGTAKWPRTTDACAFNAALYQLSYRGTYLEAKGLVVPWRKWRFVRGSNPRLHPGQGCTLATELTNQRVCYQRAVAASGSPWCRTRAQRISRRGKPLPWPCRALHVSCSTTRYSQICVHPNTCDRG